MKAVLFVLTIYLLAHVRAHKKCKLPTPQVVDWSRVKGEWFNVINLASPGDKVIKCLQLRNFRELNHGFSYHMEDYHIHTGTYEGITSTFKEIKPGVYVIQKENNKKWMKIVKKDLPYVSATLVMPTLKEANELRHSTVVFYTDYKNYLIDFRCYKNGHTYLWIMGKNPNPTAQDVLRITNVLAKVGKGWNALPLYLAGCATTRYDLSLFEHA